MTIISARGLAIGYGSHIVAEGIDLALSAGTVTCLLGPNGVGKTTLFKTLLGLHRPLAGKVELRGEDLTRLSRAQIAREIAYVPQADPSAFAFTVLDLVVMGRTAHLGAFSSPGQRDVDIATAALDSLGIAALAHRDAMRISGGQRQLALIARALAQQAGIIVMDEPTASLDIANRILVLDRIKALSGEGLAVIVSTHDPEQAFEIGDRAAVFAKDMPFAYGPTSDMLTDAALSRLYGVPLSVERTPRGRVSVGRA